MCHKRFYWKLKVGNYFKFFVKNGGQFILWDWLCEFKIRSKKYFEININKFCLKLFTFKLPWRFRKTRIFWKYNFNIEICSRFVDDRKNIRWFLVGLSYSIISKNEISGSIKNFGKKYEIKHIVSAKHSTKVNHLLRMIVCFYEGNWQYYKKYQNNSKYLNETSWW